MVTPSKLTPINRFVACFGMIPSSYKEAMTYEEQLVWLCNYLETEILPAINNNADGLVELQQLYVELKNYVDNYFDNLDVQEEINNKLDAMVESGELQEIITSYLAVKGVLGFNTVADMKAGTNFIDGSIARTLGKTTYNDKEGSFYYIRDLKNTDVIDEINIIAITNYPDLVAEKIKDKAIEDLQTETASLQNQIDNIDVHDERNAIYIGNSFCKGIGSSDDDTGLFALTKNKLYDHAYLKYGSGTGFTAYDENHTTTFYTLLQQAIADTTIDNDTITDINFVCAWGETNGIAYDTNYNADLAASMSNIKTAISNNFPNIKRINVINSETRPKLNYSNDRYYYQLFDAHKRLKVQCLENGFIYCGWIGFEILLKSSLFATDDTHPNNNGYKRLAQLFIDAINGQFQYQTKTATGYLPFSNIEGNRVIITAKVRPEDSELILQNIDQSQIPTSPTLTANTYASIKSVLTDVIPPVRTTETDANDNTKKINNLPMNFKFIYGNVQSSSSPIIMGSLRFYTTIAGDDFGIKWSVPTGQIPSTKPTTTNTSIIYPNSVPTIPLP